MPSRRINKVIIHAGLHKTGTSAIQRFCSHNRQFLLRNGIYYPPTDPFDAHHLLASRLKGVTEETAGLIIEEYMNSDFIADSQTNNIVISSEMFSEGVDPCFISRLLSYCNNLELVFYVRRQDELLESAYGQQVKQNGECRDIHEYIPYMTHIDRHLDWYKCMLDESAKIRVRIYDRSLLVNGDIVEDFVSECLGISEDLPSQSILPAIINESLSVPACLLLMRVNSFGLPKDKHSIIRDLLLAEFNSIQFKTMKLLCDQYEVDLLVGLAETNKRLDDIYLGYPYFQLMVPRDKSYCDYRHALQLANDHGILERIEDVVNSKFDWC